MTDFESSRRDLPTGLTGALQRPRPGIAPLPDLAVVAGGDGGFSSRTFFQGRAVGPQRMDNIETRMRKPVAAQLGVEECDIRLDSDFRSDFGTESPKVVELAMALGAELGVEIADDDVGRIEAVRQVIDYPEEAVPT